MASDRVSGCVSSPGSCCGSPLCGASRSISVSVYQPNPRFAHPVPFDSGNDHDRSSVTQLYASEPDHRAKKISQAKGLPPTEQQNPRSLDRWVCDPAPSWTGHRVAGSIRRIQDFSLEPMRHKEKENARSVAGLYTRTLQSRRTGRPGQPHAGGLLPGSTGACRTAMGTDLKEQLDSRHARGTL